MKTNFIESYEEFYSLCVHARTYVDCMRLMIPKYTNYAETLKQKSPNIWADIINIVNKHHEKIHS